MNQEYKSILKIYQDIFHTKENWWRLAQGANTKEERTIRESIARELEGILTDLEQTKEINPPEDLDEFVIILSKTERNMLYKKECNIVKLVGNKELGEREYKIIIK